LLKENKMSITDLNSNGNPFRMRVIQKGDAYGLNMKLVHDKDEPVVEFYDAKHVHEHDPSGAPLGQFVSRYYLSSLTGEDEYSGNGIFALGQGLNLHGGVDAWTLSAECIADAEVALFEAGFIDEVKSPSLAFGYMEFRAEAPRRDLDPYPSVTPQALAAETAAEWAEVFCVSQDKDKLIENSMEDTLDTDEPCRYCGGSCPKDQGNACDGFSGDIDDLYEDVMDEDDVDNVFAVIINADGQMRVYHDEPRYVLATHEAADILEAHEVTPPSNDDTPSI
jgi:hypothetical protein